MIVFDTVSIPLKITVLATHTNVNRASDEVGLRQYPLLCPLWDYVWDTRFSFSRMADFKRDVVPNRGKQAFEQRNALPQNKLFIVYHFITPFAGGSKKWAMKVNKRAVLKQRLSKLTKQTGHIPNFVQVDFFEYPHNDIFKIINDFRHYPDFFLL